MIPAPRGVYAVFGEHEIWHHDNRRLPVIAFDGETALVVHKTGLMATDQFDNFIGLECEDKDDADAEVTSIIPGGGWYVEWENDKGDKFEQRIACWGLRVDGAVVPMVTADANSTDLMQAQYLTDKFKINHPKHWPDMKGYE